MAKLIEPFGQVKVALKTFPFHKNLFILPCLFYLGILIKAKCHNQNKISDKITETCIKIYFQIATNWLISKLIQSILTQTKMAKTKYLNCQ